ncbi:hypothetical protein [Actinacidiphila oryziradicis]|uniref:Uncharacterized protein n=1 Tax=Actinacidiphila oryziradicis TaxID=2571141 RepID=A0A4U0SNY9_9ACTN|nr:hypothetical protein [Actinacidiphila oryziradicis]TKA11750.1 hypothetical protein FCI23_10495 [Actinacidiphila oryziradicis]
MPETAAQGSTTLACGYCDVDFTPSGRGPVPRFCSRRCRGAWRRLKEKRRVEADRIAKALPQMTGAQRRHFEQYEQLLRMSLAIRGARRKGDA